MVLNKKPLKSREGEHVLGSIKSMSITKDSINFLPPHLFSLPQETKVENWQKLWNKIIIKR